MSPPTHFLSGTGKPPPEKSKFLQTCNRLSLFLKENNINLGINAKFDATTTGGIETSGSEAAEARTIDLLSTIDDDTAAEKPAANVSPPPPPEYVILDSSCELVSNPPTNKGGGGGGSSSSSSSSAQMTIFYGGQVVVLDDVPAERAKDVMLMAAQKPQPQLSKSAAAGVVGGGGEKDSDLPIARRASLHKFLAKRKDRSATVRASPYCPPGASSSSSGNDHTFDLNSNPPT